ncbi:hypothetical protein VCR15J2_390004 [Vibrio coralliirubri]|nr:hypothetical protein VCR15J2_390004 [Vibrio coralliirubri]
MAPDKILRMPADLFWVMHGCIDRINAEKDLRAVATSQCAMSSEAATQTTEHLVLLKGEVYRMGGYFVKAEPGASDKLRALMRK